VSTDGLTNATAIGNGAIVNASHKVRIGNTAVTVIEGQAVAYTTSDGRFKSELNGDVPGLDFIAKLKPVTYHFNYQKYSRFLGEKNVDQAVLRQKDEKREMGFIAQDVEKTMREMGLDVSNLLHAPSDDHDNYSIAYGQLVVPLVKAVQELQGQNKAQQNRYDALQQQHAALEARLSALERVLTASASNTPSTQK